MRCLLCFMFNLFLMSGLFAALVFLPIAMKPNNLPRSIIKTVPLLCFGVAGILAGAPWLLVAGLLLSAAGDFSLSRDGTAAFVVGLVCFAIAHIAYILHFVQVSGAYPFEAFQSAPLLAVLLVLVMLSTEVWVTPYTGNLRWPIRGYVLVIGVMGLSALLEPSGFRLWGAVLFILSDLLLAVDLFRLDPASPARRFTGYPLWVFYVAGQAFLLLSVV